MAERIRGFDWSRTPLGPIRGLVCCPAHHRRFDAGQQVSHAVVVGARLHLHLQRRLHSNSRPQAPERAGSARPRVLVRDLGHPQAPDRHAVQRRTVDLDRGFRASHPAFGLHRGDALYRCLQSGARRRDAERYRRACSRRCTRSAKRSSPSAASPFCAIWARRRRRTLPKKHAASRPQTLARHGKDVPFALLYLVDLDGAHARLAGAAGIEPGQGASPQVVSLDPARHRSGLAARGGVPRTRHGGGRPTSASRFDAVPAGPWPEPPHAAVLLPLRSNKADEPFGLMVGGVVHD